MKKDVFSAGIATIYLLIYLSLIEMERIQPALLMLAFSPIVLIWMVYTILKKGKYTGRSLGKDEYGYADKNNEDLGII